MGCFCEVFFSSPGSEVEGLLFDPFFRPSELVVEDSYSVGLRPFLGQESGVFSYNVLFPPLESEPEVFPYDDPFRLLDLVTGVLLFEDLSCFLESVLTF